MATTDHYYPRPRALFRNIFLSAYTTIGKRLLDLMFALFLLPILLPVIGVLWVMVRRHGGTGFYSHQRIGRNGKPFSCWKIRTMVPNAERLLEEVLAQDPRAAEEWERTQKLTHDPRITPLGHFLRRTSLDELPQIWNVLRGDMSFVGPRPVTCSELDRYGKDAGVYLNLRPGITGLWQIKGRANTLDAFLETATARRLASQYLFYFAGQSQTQVADTGPLVARAIQSLSRFDLVGDLSDPRAFHAALRSMTGGPLPFWHRNRARHGHPIPPALRSRLEKLCAPDMEVYETCRTHRAAA